MAALRDLRAAIDAALVALEPLTGVIAAWEGSQEPQERAPDPAAPMVPGAAPDAAGAAAVASAGADH